MVVDGRIVAVIAEERLRRVKHWSGLPSRSVQEVLRLGGLTMDAIDIVAVPNAGPLPRLNYLFDMPDSRREKPDREPGARGLLRAALAGAADIRTPRSLLKLPLAPKTDILHVEHHLAHAASAYYTSGNSEKQLIVTMDGIGEGVSTAVWRGENGKIEPLQRWSGQGSLGWFYANVTEALGWWHGHDEGKTMGLAPYGDPDAAEGLLDRFCPKFAAGDLVEPHDYGVADAWDEGGATQWHLPDANDIAALIPSIGREDLAAEAQRLLEDQAVEVVFPWMEKEGTSDLSCAGGVFLNVKLNQRVWYSGNVAKQHVYPDPGDAGLAVGAALYAWHQASPGSPIGGMDDLYWGPEFSNDEIRQMLEARNLPQTFVEDPAGLGADALSRNQIVGWFQGRMEAGPRALGGRSILMSPLRAENKDAINARVKFREAFRPFCPSMLSEKADDYLVEGRQEEYMITSFDVQPGKREAIPAVVHVDGTVRPQTVRRQANERYWDLISGFGERTGEYVVLDTSFNVMGEPMVCHPRDAIRDFYDTGMDLLILGNYALRKDIG